MKRAITGRNMKRKRNFSVISFFVLMLGIFILFSVSDFKTDTSDSDNSEDMFCANSRANFGYPSSVSLQFTAE